MNYQESLDYIYKSYMDIKQRIKGKDDSEVRNPERLLNLMQELSILPQKSKTIKITGSKGKGTTTRLVQKSIRSVYPNANIATLTSPEEIEHTDRMKINGQEISQNEFAQILSDIKPKLEQIQNEFDDLEYLSPSGLFVLIAFIWFAKHEIDYFVLETGRGAKFDEIGRLETNVSIVTSILLEHPAYLGGSLESIAQHKLYACETADFCVLDKTAVKFYNKNIYKTPVIDIKNEVIIPNYPDWYSNNVLLAIAGVSALINITQDDILKSFLKSDEQVVASFGMKDINGTKYYYDPAISSKSIDKEFLNSLNTEVNLHSELTFIISMPDDKETDGIVKELSKYGIVKHIVLDGTRGYLDYNNTINNYSDSILWRGEFNDKDGFKQAIKTVDSKIVYCLGTQTYIRLVKQTLFGF